MTAIRFVEVPVGHCSKNQGLDEHENDMEDFACQDRCNSASIGHYMITEWENGYMVRDLVGGQVIIS